MEISLKTFTIFLSSSSSTYITSLYLALDKSEKFFNLFSSPDESYMISSSIGHRPEFSSLSTYSSFRSIVDSVSDGDLFKENRIQLTTTEVNDRFKKFIVRAVDFLLMRGKY